MTVGRGLAIAAALAAVATRANAAPASPEMAEPDPSAVEAGDANLASEGRRSGVTFAAALGGGLMAGFGLQDSVGSGGSLSLRLGRVATPRTVLNLELSITAALHKLATASDVASNSETNIVIGPQYYVNPSFWVRGAAGIGVYNANQVQLSGGQIGTQTTVGPAAVFGLGVDLARFKSFVIDIELATGVMISGSGALVTAGADLGIAFD